jgi:hypothetical protein
VRTYISHLKERLDRLQPGSESSVFQAMVDTPFADPVEATRKDLGIVVLLLVNPRRKTIDRIALSKTSMAEGAVLMSAKPFHSIRIPLGQANNIIAQAITRGELTQTSDWKSLFAPALTAKEARFNQSGAGIETSVVAPIGFRHGGAMIFSFYQPPANLGPDHYYFVKTYSRLVDEKLKQLLGH